MPAPYQNVNGSLSFGLRDSWSPQFGPSFSDLAEPLNSLLESNGREVEGGDSALWCLGAAVRGDQGSPDEGKS